MKKKPELVSITDCGICKNLRDHESIDDPFDGVDLKVLDDLSKLEDLDRSSELPYLKPLALIRKLVDLRGFDNRVKRCPLCGTFYLYSHRSIPYSDHDVLELSRFNEEETKIYRQLLEARDEVSLYNAPAIALSHEDESVRHLAQLIFTGLTQNLIPTRTQIGLLNRLLFEQSPTARAFASGRLASLAKENKVLAPTEEMTSAIPGFIMLLSDEKAMVKYSGAEALREIAKRGVDLSHLTPDLVRVLRGIHLEAYNKFPAGYKFSDPELNRELAQVITTILGYIARRAKSNAKSVLDELKRAEVNERIPEVRKLMEKCQAILKK
ncbi:MAG: hypothetical protein AB1641_31110 [Thermodesulfobacteriota bacterium]